MKYSYEDFDQCAAEPIHIPGLIQPHGCLLAFDRSSLVILQASANAGVFLNSPATDLLTRRISEILPQPLSRQLVNALRDPAPSTPLVLCLDELTVLHHELDGISILEIERSTSTFCAAPDIGTTILRLSMTDSLDTLLQATVQLVRNLSGFDRVVLYRFDEDGHGEVVFEDKAEDMSSYLGLHFPESDIPRQARELYLRTWVRAIPDGCYEPVPLVSARRPDNGRALDLSGSVLRSVSPVHLQYMANMGVQASLSVSLIVQGHLWGLISCGHRKTRPMPYQLRAACETIGRMVSLQIGALEALELQRRQAEKAFLLLPLTRSLRQQKAHGFGGLPSEPEALLTIALATGVAVVVDDSVTCVGRCPSSATVLALAQWLDERVGDDGSFSTCKLSIEDPQWAACADVASGVLAIVLPTPMRNCVIWFRPETIQTMEWGGNPTKPAGPRLHPRRSFDRWKQEVRHRARRWERADILAAADLRRSAIEIDLTRQVQRAQEAVDLREELMAVVAHDLRSPLTVVVLQATIIQRLLTQDATEATPRIRASAQTIQRASERMQSLLYDLLDLARIEAGRFQIEPSWQSTSSLLQEAYQLLHPLCEAKKITLILRPAPDLAISADPERIFQVFSNLIGNAVKFSPTGKKIEIDVVPVDGNLCRISVADNGNGMDPEELPRIFDRYWQGGSPSSESGAGLGLHIAKGIVEAHGGTIWATSRPGRGTTVFFTLPLNTGSV